MMIVEIRHRERRARDLEYVGTQIGDFLFHIKIRALHDGHHRDKRGHAHRQAQQLSMMRAVYARAER